MKAALQVFMVIYVLKKVTSKFPVDCQDTSDIVGERLYKPDPESCAHFYQCDTGVPVRFQCGPGTYFNPRAAIGEGGKPNAPGCDFPYRVDCKDGRRGPVSNENKPTTLVEEEFPLKETPVEVSTEDKDLNQPNKWYKTSAEDGNDSYNPIKPVENFNKTQFPSDSEEHNQTSQEDAGLEDTITKDKPENETFNDYDDGYITTTEETDIENYPEDNTKENTLQDDSFDTEPDIQADGNDDYDSIKQVKNFNKTQFPSGSEEHNQTSQGDAGLEDTITKDKPEKETFDDYKDGLITATIETAIENDFEDYTKENNSPEETFVTEPAIHTDYIDEYNPIPVENFTETQFPRDTEKHNQNVVEDFHREDTITKDRTEGHNEKLPDYYLELPDYE